MKSIFCLIAGFLSATHPLSAESWWPQFRGPNCSGISETARPPSEFGPGKNELWKVEIPSGMSSPVIWGDRIFLTAFDQGKLLVVCLGRKDGKILWRKEVPAEKLEEFHPTEGSPASSSCVTDGKHVVSYFGSCGLVCHDFEGRELWHVSMPPVVTAGGFGTGSSPVLANGLVFVNRDFINNCSLLAIDIKSGKKVWEALRPDVWQSYGSPIVWSHDGTEEVVMSGSMKLKSYDLKTGQERWTLNGLPSFACTTPVTGDGLLFFAGWAPGKSDGPLPSFQDTAAAHDKNKDGIVTWEEAKGSALEPYFRAQDINADGKLTVDDEKAMKELISKGENVLIAVKPGGKGELSSSHVAWKRNRGLPYVPSPLFYQGRVYIVKDGGIVSCYKAKTGEAVFEQERLPAQGTYYASPVAADGKIFFASLDGKLTAIAAGDHTAPKVLFESDFKERIAPTPALAEKQVIIRGASHLWAFGESL